MHEHAWFNTLNDTKARPLTQKLDKGLNLTKPNHDKHIIKHLVNMQPIGVNNIIKCRDLILI